MLKSSCTLTQLTALTPTPLCKRLPKTACASLSQSEDLLHTNVALAHLKKTHRQHVVALHVSGALVVALVVKFAEEVEGHHRVEIDHHSQETQSQDQLADTHTHTSTATAIIINVTHFNYHVNFLWRKTNHRETKSRFICQQRLTAWKATQTYELDPLTNTQTHTPVFHCV